MQDKSSKVMVKIHGLSFFEGLGVGKSEEGKVIFVDETCPEDFVEAEIYKEQKKFAFAKVSKPIEASPFRVEPKCSVFHECGGCTLQHVSYDVQIKEKQKVLERYHQRHPDFELDGFQDCNQTYNYRRRIEVHAKNNRWGFYQKKSTKLVYPDQCQIIHEDLQKHLEQFNAPDGHYHVDAKGIKPRSRGTQGVFEQINGDIDQKIKIYLKKLLSEDTEKFKQVFDLYAGQGNYSLALARDFSDVNFVAVELSQALVQKGQMNASSVSNITWVCSDVLKYIKSKGSQDFSKGIILVNPPRDGLDSQFLQALRQLRPSKLLYVSCNPMTLFRDIDALSPNFRLKRLKGFDMFPQTMHFETVALLSPT